MSESEGTARTRPRWIEGTANRVVTGICAVAFLATGVWAGATAPASYLAERAARAAGPPVVMTATTSSCNLIPARGVSRCWTRFRLIDREGVERVVSQPGEFDPGTTRLGYPDLADPRRVYRADRRCCEGDWGIALSVVGLGGGGMLVAGLLLPRRRRG